ncbi:MAG: bis(5'-nucleosyl)-tetraphosphatase (symmetrical) YqeK [Candidatus Margulisiibacteriota bacterium]
MINLDDIKDRLKKLLPLKRFEHSLRVEKEAVKLARHYHIPETKAAVAALLHDCSRFMDGKRMLKQALSWGLKIGPMEKFEPKLLHAKLSAVIARRKFKIKDPDILSAIERHTVGAEKMSRLDKIIYLADHIEDTRNYKGVKGVKKLAFRDLDAAVAESTSSMIGALLKKGLPIFEATVKTRNAHLKLL